MPQELPVVYRACQSRNLLALLLASLLILIGCRSFSGTQPSEDFGAKSPLPLPASMPLRNYEELLYTWLLEQQYKQLEWQHDVSVRDTGPYIRNEYFGTHPAVRIFYSPEVMRWLERGRTGEIPDGAMIIKEMYPPPAVLYQELEQDPQYQSDPAAYEALLGKLVTSWTVMVKDQSASKDGWFWANPGAAKENQSIAEAVAGQLDDYSHALYSSFGAPCLRCHGSAENELTFSTLRNIEGYTDGEYPMRFMVDNSWRRGEHLQDYPLSILKDDPYALALFNIPALQRPWSAADQTDYVEFVDQHTRAFHSITKPSKMEALTKPSQEFLQQFPSLAGQSIVPRKFPSQWSDHVVPGPEGAQAFITSSNCLGCHGGLGGLPYGLTMFLQTGPKSGEGFNISEYGEWRWSPMGLAGRDPIFHAQLESEMHYIVEDGNKQPTPLKASVAETQQAITNTCLSCHGGMGQRQLSIDAENNPALNSDFKVEYFYLTEQLSEDERLPENYAYHEYGELAREGISCAMCHRIDKPSKESVLSWKPEKSDWLNSSTPKELAYSLFHNSTGRFVQGPNDAFFGPYDDVSELPMDHVLGAKPVYNEFTSDSQLCGTCHTINLPNIGKTDFPFPVLDSAQTNPAFKEYSHSIEQATFLEWQNSAFAWEGDTFASCQDCHMPSGFKSLDGEIDIASLTTQIASIQDSNYPAAEETIPLEDLTIALRPDYKRHEHVGLNVFLLEMFDQFPETLGVDKTDYMTSADNGVDLAIENMIRQAQQDTIDLSLSVNAESLTGGVTDTLNATVTVTNKTGHRFPSGVAFRRAFLELLVYDGDEIIWGSGRTNKVGVIVDENGKPLPTEWLPNASTYQKHHQRITEQNQVQIYEELNLNADNQFTTSFVHRVDSPKDNRLLPRGWRESSTFNSQGQVMEQFMVATDPHGVGSDPDYQDDGYEFAGQDSLTYQIRLNDKISLQNLRVTAVMYYQAIPPYWLKQRFNAAPKGKATQRLYYMTSRLNLEGTPMENWKLKLAGDSKTLTD